MSIGASRSAEAAGRYPDKSSEGCTDEYCANLAGELLRDPGRMSAFLDRIMRDQKMDANAKQGFIGKLENLLMKIADVFRKQGKRVPRALKGCLDAAEKAYRSLETSGNLAERTEREREETGKARIELDYSIGTERNAKETAFESPDGEKLVAKHPTFTQEEMQNNSASLVKMDAVKALTGNEFAANGKKLIDNVLDFFKSLHYNVHSKLFGDVGLFKSSAKSDIAHGITRMKNTAYAAIPEVIQNGKVISVIDKGRGVERIVVAAPIQIGSERYYMAAMLQRDANTQRLYLHDVVAEKELQPSSSAILSTTGTAEESKQLSITSILLNALNVNTPENDLSGNMIQGSEGTLRYGPGNKQTIKFHYALVNVSDLVASHDINGDENEAYPPELQPRDRSRVASQQQVLEIANDIIPEKLGQSGNVQDGAPIIGRDMIVESGNGRTIALQYAAQQSKSV